MSSEHVTNSDAIKGRILGEPPAIISMGLDSGLDPFGAREASETPGPMYIGRDALADYVAKSTDTDARGTDRYALFRDLSIKLNTLPLAERTSFSDALAKSSPVELYNAKDPQKE